MRIYPKPCTGDCREANGCREELIACAECGKPVLECMTRVNRDGERVCENCGCDEEGGER